MNGIKKFSAQLRGYLQRYDTAVGIYMYSVTIWNYTQGSGDCYTAQNVRLLNTFSTCLSTFYKSLKKTF